MQIGVHKVAMASPNDVSELAKLIDSGHVIRHPRSWR